MKTILLSSLVLFTLSQVAWAQDKKEEKIKIIKEEIIRSDADSGNDTQISVQEISSDAKEGKIVVTTKIKNGDIVKEKTVVKDLSNLEGFNSDSLVNQIIRAIGQDQSNDSLLKMFMFNGDPDKENLIWIKKDNDQTNWINIDDLEELDEIQMYNHDRPFLGVILDDDGSTPKGIKVISVIENSAAALAGIQKDDIITAIDNSEINDLEDLVQHLRQKKIGDKIQVEVNRNGTTNSFEAILKCKADSQFNIGQSFKFNAPACCENTAEECKHHQRSYMAYMSRSKPKLGVLIENLDEEMISDLRIKDGKGVLITKILDGSTAKEMGLKINDVIVKLNDFEINDVSSLQDALADQEMSKDITITYYRYGKLKTTTGQLFEFNQNMMDNDWWFHEED
ncbi:MAG: PDZ domain-containing protein [Bacteroidetes bacterium]|nr:PDZ domain-containing protein [Bacteroidota bacterium]